MDPYKVLGIEKNASKEVAKKAYRKLAHRFHPDKNPGNKKAEENFKKINEAWDRINDPDKYTAKEPQGGWESVRNVYQNIKDRMNQDRVHNININFEQQDEPPIINVTLSFAESCLGSEKEIAYQSKSTCKTCRGIGAKEGGFTVCVACNGQGKRIVSRSILGYNIAICEQCKGKKVEITVPCESCNGSGEKELHRKTKISIPSCVETGMHMNVRTEHGDVVVVFLRVEETKTRHRQGLDIYSKKTLSLKDSLLGCKIDVPTIHSDTVVTVKPCTSPGTKIRLQGRGAKHPNQDVHGDHFVHVEVKYPKTLTEEQKDKIKEVLDDIDQNRTGAN